MKYYQCLKCGKIFADETSEKFVKTMIKRCPVCGSSDIALSGNKNINKQFIKKTNK